MPATMFGPCETVPHGYWVYQSGRVAAKVNVQTAGLHNEEVNAVRALWQDLETPLAPLPPPDAALYDATVAITSTVTPPCTQDTATCPACVQKRYKRRAQFIHTRV